MSVHAHRGARLAALTLAVGIATAAGQTPAWADTGPSETGNDSSQQAPTNPKSGIKRTPRLSGTAVRSPRDPSETTASQPDSTTAPRGHADPELLDGSTVRPRRSAVRPDSAATVPTGAPSRTGRTTVTLAADISAPSEPSTRAATVIAPPSIAATTVTTPTPPAPLSPIAKIAALPGQIINRVLQVLGFTVAADGPRSPFNINPIESLLFAAFRTVEHVLGLDRTPAVVLTPPTEIYTGPTTGKTPTVAQFLNASAAGYGLGTAPGGLVPFTVHGRQMVMTNPISGTSAQVWVTPDSQVIISYQGTTGGTNLLFNPIIAIPQIITDLQVIFTDTTPQAFRDALYFQGRVVAAAAAQGYETDDIFVTGHSLGAWQAQYVAQQTGMGGIGFEGPGLNTKVPGNGVDSGFVNIATYGDTAAYFSTDIPGLQPFMPPYVPGGGAKPHYGSIVMIGDPAAAYPMINTAARLGWNPIHNIVFLVDILVNFFQYHLPGVQAYHLDVDPDPGVVPWLGEPKGPVLTGYGELTISQLKAAASQAGRLFTP